jgi:nucleoside-diphosphate-sugar epimerase
MNILIVGASGLIGQNLICKLSSLGFNLYCQSRKKQISKYKEIWIEHDLITQDWHNLGLPQVEVVYFLAGQTSIYYADESPSSDLIENVLGFIKLLEYLRNFNKNAFVVYTGTATQCGIPEASIIDEMVPDNPVSFYDLSKLTAEQYLLQFIRHGYVNGCSLRLANVFGGIAPGQKLDRGIIDRVFNRAISGKDITIFGDGNNLRDYIYIKDVISAFIELIDNRDSINGEVFYLSSGNSISLVNAFTTAINLAHEKNGVKVNLISQLPPAHLQKIEERSVKIDSKKIQLVTSWRPNYTLESGLRDSYNIQK